MMFPKFRSKYLQAIVKSESMYLEIDQTVAIIPRTTVRKVPRSTHPQWGLCLFREEVVVLLNPFGVAHEKVRYIVVMRNEDKLYGIVCEAIGETFCEGEVDKHKILCLGKLMGINIEYRTA